MTAAPGRELAGEHLVRDLRGAVVLDARVEHEPLHHPAVEAPRLERRPRVGAEAGCVGDGLDGHLDLLTPVRRFFFHGAPRSSPAGWRLVRGRGGGSWSIALVRWGEGAGPAGTSGIGAGGPAGPEGGGAAPR